MASTKLFIARFQGLASDDACEFVTLVVKSQGMVNANDLIMRIWESVSTERHLQGVLEAATDILLPIVAYEGLAVIHFDGPQHELYALHAPDNPLRQGESIQQFLQRATAAGLVACPDKPLRPYEPREPTDPLDYIYSCPDLWNEPAWYEHEHRMARSGVRAYCSMTLPVRGKAIGGVAYSRRQPIPFTGAELALLQQVAKPLAVAVSNALANEEITRLRAQLQQENVALRAALAERAQFRDLVGDCGALRSVLAQAEEVASTDATVLITGETGTGKELIARAIHARSPRSSGPMIKVNCGALPPNLIASELFGHEKGAFTGAIERRKGRFEQANGGTLFLDEVGELPADVQSLLLRALQEREFERVGGSTTIRADVRIIAATNRDLAKEMRCGRFRSDLFYRLHVFPVHMPPLRERPEDIPSLVAHFAALYSKRFQRAINLIDEASLLALQAYDWPGNIRELENAVERAVILARDGVLRTTVSRLAGGHSSPTSVASPTERNEIENVLRECRGRISGENGAAKRLGIPASTLEFRIRRLGIDKFQFRGARPGEFGSQGKVDRSC